MGCLDGKIILITGAAGAVGAAVSTVVRREGGTAIATDLAGSGALDHPLDVTRPADWERVVSTLERGSGRLDGLVNAAGIVVVGTIEDLDFADWRRALSVNLDGAFLGCKYAFPLLRRQGGSIVNLSSVYGVIGAADLPAYTASKGGLGLLTKSVALAGARLDPPIRCNAICPAFLEGAMVERVAEDTYPGLVAQRSDLVRKYFTRDVPLGRFGKPAEIAELCVYLLSDKAGFLTGSDVLADGGMSAH